MKGKKDSAIEELYAIIADLAKPKEGSPFADLSPEDRAMLAQHELQREARRQSLRIAAAHDRYSFAREQDQLRREVEIQPEAAWLQHAISVEGLNQILHAFLLERAASDDDRDYDADDDAAELAYEFVGAGTGPTFDLLAERFGDIGIENELDPDRQLPQKQAFEQGFRLALELIVPILRNPLGGVSLDDVIQKAREDYADAFQVHLEAFDAKRASAE